MRTKGTGNRKKKKCRTGEGNATWGNSDLDLASKRAFAWSQDLHLWWLVCPVFFLRTLHFLLACKAMRGQSWELKLIVSFLLFLFLVISPTGTKAEPIPYYCVIFAHSSAGLPACPVLRSLQGGAGVWSPLPQGYRRLTGLFSELLLSSAVALALYTEIFPWLNSTACI